MINEELARRLISALDNNDPIEFAKRYLEVGMGPLTGAALIVSYPQHSQRISKFTKFANMVGQALSAYPPNVLQDPLVVLKLLHTGVVSNEKSTYDEARRQDSQGKLAEILGKYYLLESESERGYFTRHTEWDAHHKVNDALRHLGTSNQK